MKIGANIEINKDQLPEPVKAGNVKHNASMKNMDKQSVKEHSMTQDDNSRMITEMQNDEKLAITFWIMGTCLIAYHFL